MVYVTRKEQITKQELRIRGSRINRREQLRTLTRRPDILYIDRDQIPPEIEAIIQDGGVPPIPVTFAPEGADQVEIKFEEEQETEDNNRAETPSINEPEYDDPPYSSDDNWSTISTLPTEDYERFLNLNTEEYHSDFVEFSPSPSPLSFVNSTEEDADFTTIFNLSNDALDLILGTLDEDSLADFWTEIESGSHM